MRLPEDRPEGQGKLDVRGCELGASERESSTGLPVVHVHRGHLRNRVQVKVCMALSVRTLSGTHQTGCTLLGASAGVWTGHVRSFACMTTGKQWWAKMFVAHAFS